MRRELRALVCLVICLLMQAVAVFPHHHHHHLLCVNDDLAAQECEAGHEDDEHDDCCGGSGCCAGCATHIVTADEVVEDDDFLPDYSFYSLIYSLFDCVSVSLSREVGVDTVFVCGLHDGVYGDGMGRRGPPVSVES